MPKPTSSYIYIYPTVITIHTRLIRLQSLHDLSATEFRLYSTCDDLDLKVFIMAPIIDGFDFKGFCYGMD
ncbi:hypothetical protein L6452_13167 [Arctium lappa]|uniref:Uncharacterized protein n=1 Tax=Arctium lappa TaxID=4217 RepID=A0ACB9CHG3_ARCLA|nr:hypothetical protein L6452_13167 [Arctium lappa]